MMNFILGELFL